MQHRRFTPESFGFTIDAFRKHPIPHVKSGALPGIHLLPVSWRSLAQGLWQHGLITGVSKDRFTVGETEFVAFKTSKVIEKNTTDGHLLGAPAHGMSTYAEEAISKALGECLERYPFVLYRNNSLLSASVADLEVMDCDHINPEQICRFSKEQKEWFPNRAFDTKSIFRWVEAVSLIDKRKVYVPAQCVFWNYCTHNHRSHSDSGSSVEPYLAESNTSGLGAYFNFEGAMLSGIYEIVQRDGFFLHWLNGHPPSQIDISELDDPVITGLVEQAADDGLSITFLDTTTEVGIPSCICVAVSSAPERAYLTFGAGCSLDAVGALQDALFEGFQFRNWIEKNNYRYQIPQDYIPFRTAGIAHGERTGLWALAGRKDADFFFNGARIPVAQFLARGRVTDSLVHELDCVTDIFRRLGQDYEPFFYRADSPILASLGFESVRIIIPKLLSFYIHEEDAPLGSPRLREAPLHLEFSPATALNPVPHPFL